MVEVWFALLCVTLTMFVVLDGWDIGAGILHLIVARNDRERREVIAALGPLWSWHEVWLLAAGATFLFAFPSIMSAAFSGFYLTLWLVLWSFLLRGMAIEVGGHIDDRLWQSGWDVVFASSSVLLAVLFGAAMGNVIRGVPLDETGRFSLPLFSNFGVRGQIGILDWYTLSVAVLTTAILAAHGATYLRFKTKGRVHARTERWARWLWPASAILFVVVTIQTWIVRPELGRAAIHRPVAWLAMAAVAAGVWAVWTGVRGRAERRALAGSCTIIAGLLAGAAASVFPVMLRSTLAPEYSLTAYAGAAARHGLVVALVWWPAAALLAVSYAVVTMRSFSGKVRAAEDAP
jgi:cytochrome bd ubiquinol oxidase subunit II